MADRKSISALSKQHVTVEPYSVMSVDFIDSKPNYFRVQNSGETPVYCSASAIPNAKQYDFMVRGGSLMTFADPFAKTKLYIFNPSGSAVDCVVVSFYAEFDPLVLALGQIEIEIPDTITTSNIITGFNSQLPAGENNIGKVTVANLPADYAKQSKSYAVYAESSSLDSTGVSTASGDGKRITNINFLSNDGENAIWVTVDQDSGVYPSIRVNPGEVLQNVKVYAYNITVDAGIYTSSFRAVYEFEEV